MRALVCLLLVGCGGGATHEGSPDAAIAVDAATTSDGAVATATATLRVHYPAGTHAITLRGEAPLSWDAGATMTNVGTDTWQTTVSFGDGITELQWKPLLDDQTWSRGANYVVHRGDSVDVYPHFVSTAGTVSQLFTSFHSTTLGNDRVVWVYLPASYAENTDATYPVLYMHDGQNLFSTQPTFGTNGWQVDASLDAASETSDVTATIREFIVVAPENAGTQRTYEYTPTYDASEMAGGGGDKYLTMLVSELKPQVDQMLRTQPGRTTTGILGSSLGGLISVYAGTTHADTYGLVGALSPSTWWDNETIVADVKAMTTPRPDKVYADCGTDGTTDDEDGLTETQDLFDAFPALGYVEGQTFEHVIQPGAQHMEKYWAERFPGAVQFLWGTR